MLSRFRPPQQTRSQETLHRILDAAERVLDGKSFSEATLAEIMEQAGVTVGAFYRRFPDKDALLHHLDERYFSEQHERAEQLLDPARWDGRPLREIIDAFALSAVTVYRARRGLLRSLFLRARTDPVIQATARRVNARYIDALRTLVLARPTELTHPDPASAVALGFAMFMGALRETVLFGEVWPEPHSGPDEDLARELARLLRGYLGVS